MRTSRAVLLLNVVLLCSACIPLAGCGTVGVLASSTKTFRLDDSLALKRPAPDYYEAATDVGNALGFQVSAISKSTGQIGFVKGSNEFTTVMIGKIERVAVELDLSKDQKSIDIKVEAVGNFDTASQAAVSKVVEDFKAGLATRLGV